MTVRLPFRGPEDLPAAVAAIRETVACGGVCAFPTETYYGLGCDPWNRDGVARVFTLKGRPQEKALPLVAADLAQVEELAELDGVWRERLHSVWPAPCSVVLPVRRLLPASGSTVAVRVPAHSLLRGLLARTGPLTSTSANAAGGPSPVTGEEVEAFLGPGLDLLLDGGRTPGGAPSTVLDLTVAPPAIRRMGAWEPPAAWDLQVV